MYPNLRFEVDADGIALLTLDVAGRPMNVFTPGFTADLREAVAQIVGRDDVRGAVITSGKASGFLAGADLKDFVGFHATGGTAAQAMAVVAPGAQALRELERCGKPVAAAINGLALGGGYELCLACHHRVLLDDARAVVGLPEVTVGLLPVGGGTQRLSRLIGIARALPLLLSGRHVGPAEALALGMVDAVAPAGSLLQAARQWVLDHPGAQQPWDVKGFKLPGGAGASAAHAGASFGLTVAQVRRDTQDNLPAPLAILSAVYEGTQLPIDKGLAIEAQYFGPLLAGPVARNLMRTMFVHRGAALKRSGAAVAPAYAQRLRGVYRAEGRALLKEGVVPALIANGATQVGFAQGPLEGEAGDEAGAETGAEAPTLAIEQPPAREVGERLLSALALEAVRCLEQGVVARAADADVGAVVALGYPAWTGGPLSYIETVGLAAFVERCELWAARHGDRFLPTPALHGRASFSFYSTEPTP